MTTRTTTAETMQPAELLARLGAQTAEDLRALRAVESGTLDLLDLDALRLSPLYRKVLVDAYAGRAAVTATGLLATVQRRAAWTHAVPQRIAHALERYAGWMRAAAEQAGAADDANDDEDYGIESAYARQFATNAETATSSALVAPTSIPAALINLMVAVNAAATRSARHAQTLSRTAQDAVTEKLHGLTHTALMAARTAQQALVPAF